MIDIQPAVRTSRVDIDALLLRAYEFLCHPIIARALIDPTSVAVRRGRSADATELERQDAG